MGKKLRVLAGLAAILPGLGLVASQTPSARAEQPYEAAAPIPASQVTEASVTGPLFAQVVRRRSEPPMGADAPQSPTVTVPAVTEKSARDASTDLNNARLKPTLKSTVDSAHRPGYVVSQDPPAGTQVAPHSQVTLTVAATELAIEPGTTVDEATGRTETWGQLIAHRGYTIDLKAQNQHVPILAVTYPGRECSRGDDLGPLNLSQPRAEAIVQALSIAWTLLDDGGTMEVAADEPNDPNVGTLWRLTDPLGPQYGPAERSFPVVCIRHRSLGGLPLKILTVYPEDAAAFGQPDSLHGVPTVLTPRELADYLVALFKAHYLLFHKRVVDAESFDQLELSKTRDGRIFKEISAQLRSAGGHPQIHDINTILEQMSLGQCTRLATLAYKAPTDWRLRNKLQDTVAMADR
jgi:hypothetical protein